MPSEPPRIYEQLRRRLSELLQSAPETSPGVTAEPGDAESAREALDDAIGRVEADLSRPENELAEPPAAPASDETAAPEPGWLHGVLERADPEPPDEEAASPPAAAPAPPDPKKVVTPASSVPPTIPPAPRASAPGLPPLRPWSLSAIPRSPAPRDHAAFEREGSNADNVIDTKSSERASQEKPVPTFAHRAIARAASSTSAAARTAHTMEKLMSRTEELNKTLRKFQGDSPAVATVPVPAAPRAAQTMEKPMSRTDELNKALRKFQEDSPGVEACALVSDDGLTIASILPVGMEETRVGGMGATLLNLATRAAVQLNRGVVREVVVRGEGGYVAMIGTRRNALLMAVTNEASKLGMIFFDMHEAIRAIEKVL